MFDETKVRIGERNNVLYKELLNLDFDNYDDLVKCGLAINEQFNPLLPQEECLKVIDQVFLTKKE
jgi:hypothetical protein